MVENIFKITDEARKMILKSNEESIKDFMSANISLSAEERKKVLERFDEIKKNVILSHSANELIYPAKFILSITKDVEGCIVETGCYKGGSTAKLSIIAKLCNRKLYVLDSFEGLPKDYEEGLTRTEAGYSVDLKGGEYCGSLEEVKSNIEKYGEISVCEFIKGWYKDTLPNFKQKIVAVFCDVDFEQSTRECIKYLYPQIIKGGYFFTQDAHFPRIRKLFNDENFWKNEVGINEVPKLNMITERFGYFIKNDR